MSQWKDLKKKIVSNTDSLAFKIIAGLQLKNMHRYFWQVVFKNSYLIFYFFLFMYLL